LNLDPNADWSGCPRIDYRVTYALGLTEVFGGVPQAAGWATGGHEDDQTGNVGFKNGDWEGSLSGLGELQVGGWVKGAATGFVHFSVDSQWTIAPERMSPLSKRRLRAVVTGLEIAGDASALAGGAIALAGNGPVGGVLVLSSSLEKLSASYLQKTLDADPWDRNYLLAFRPAVAPVPAFVKGTLFRAWIKNGLKIRETSRALFVSVNRANTAMAMEDLAAEARQKRRIAVLLRQIGRLFEQEADLRSDLSVGPEDADAGHSSRPWR
jgi:hypothetical protein